MDEISKRFHSGRDLFKSGELQNTKALGGLFVEKVVFKDKVDITFMFIPDFPSNQMERSFFYTKSGIG